MENSNRFAAIMRIYANFLVPEHTNLNGEILLLFFCISSNSPNQVRTKTETDADQKSGKTGTRMAPNWNILPNPSAPN